MLNDMIFITRHGACPHEYEFDQKFKVDVWMTTDCVVKAGAVDALNLTINYADAYALVEDVMYGEHVDLLETLAYRIGNKLIFLQKRCRYLLARASLPSRQNRR